MIGSDDDDDDDDGDDDDDDDDDHSYPPEKKNISPTNSLVNMIFLVPRVGYVSSLHPTYHQPSAWQPVGPSGASCGIIRL